VLFVDRKEGTRPVQAFADEYGLTFTIGLDRNGKVANSYRVYSIPSVFFVDGNGVIQARYFGTPLEAQLDEALAAVGVVP
jgi:peroxiredoxin